MKLTYLNTEGSFLCRVNRPDNGWFGESKEKATPFIRVPLTVTEDCPEKDQVIVWQGWLSAAAFENTIARLAEVFGFDGDLPALHLEKQTLAGLPCRITTHIEVFHGKARCRVKWLNSVTGKSKPMDTEKISALLAGLTENAKSIAKTAIEKAANPVPDTAPLVDENDDVPF